MNYVANNVLLRFGKEVKKTMPECIFPIRGYVAHVALKSHLQIGQTEPTQYGNTRARGKHEFMVARRSDTTIRTRWMSVLRLQN